MKSYVQMRKDTQFTFRVPADLKTKLQNIAAIEGRSMAQICEAFLRAGSDSYDKEGAKFLRRFLGRHQGQSA
jgi:predicted transcriptional regulator